MNFRAWVPRRSTKIRTTVFGVVALASVLALTTMAAANATDLDDRTGGRNPDLLGTRDTSYWDAGTGNVERMGASAALAANPLGPTATGNHPQRQAHAVQIVGGAASGYTSQTADEDDRGVILVDNHIDVSSLQFSSGSDEAQGFTTGPVPYYLAGVELALTNVIAGTEINVVISTPAGDGSPGSTLYEMVTPSEPQGKTFFAAPDDAYLDPNTTYLVRIYVTAGFVGVGITSDTGESASSLSGWSIADHHWQSRRIGQIVQWDDDDAHVYAITVRGNQAEDLQGSDYFSAGRLEYSRHTGESTLVDAFIGATGDRDWFDIADSCLMMDAGGRYRIDIDNSGLTNAGDLRVSAFYADYPYAHSNDPVIPLTAAVVPPVGYVSWHFTTTRPCSPHIQVATVNDTVGVYGIRGVYDPDRTWMRTELSRGDLYHDDTTWATIPVDDDKADVGIYHYFADHDWFAVTLKAETSYRFSAVASSGQFSHYMYPALRLHDDDGNELAVSYGSGTAAAVINHEVGTGERGTYYLNVTSAELHDDADDLEAAGITDSVESHSPFLKLRYYVTATEVGGDRNLRSLPANAGPRIYNWTTVTLPENTQFTEYITAYDHDAQDTVTFYGISGGADQDLFVINEEGVLPMTVTPDYEVPADTDTDNRYNVQVEIKSGVGVRERSATAVFVITVTDDDSESERVLVSNTGKRAKSRATVHHSDSALRIITGANPEGYALHSVAMRFAEAPSSLSDVRVSLWSKGTIRSDIPRPEAELFAFTNPSTIRAGLAEFTAPQGTVLDPLTGYYIVIENVGDTPIKLWETGADGEDAISAAGWSIGNIRLFRPKDLTGRWNRRVDSEGDQILLRVIGYEKSAE